MMNFKKPAYSLILALLLMTVIMIVAITAVSNTQDKLSEMRDMEPSIKVQLAAESAIEQAVLDLDGTEAGYEVTSPVVAYSDEDGTLIGEYTVYSKAQENDNEGTYYYTPIPGTGTAAPSDDCSFLDEDQPVDHPCNWNKILYGETITIPLYSDDGTGTGTLSPADLGMNGWYLKIRTPCVDGSFDDSCVRSELDGVSSDYENDNTVVFWQLVGVASDGTEVTVVPDDETSSDFGTYRTSINSEIYESLINAANEDDAGTSMQYVVLEAESSSSDERYLDLFNSCCVESLGFSTVLLKITVVSPLIESDGETNIPYLEWQFVSSSTIAPADTKAILFGEATYDNTNGTYYFPILVKKNLFGDDLSIYTLSN